jgi:uncharacterized protein
MRIIGIIIMLLFVLGTLTWLLSCVNKPAQTEFQQEILVGSKYVKIVQVAETPLQHFQGLSKKSKICEDCGMLFMFSKKGYHTFVMRDMRFPLEIIWISDDKIVKIDQNLPPEGSLPVNDYSSGQPINKVLEVNAGFSANNHINIGDTIK